MDLPYCSLSLTWLCTKSLCTRLWAWIKRWDLKSSPSPHSVGFGCLDNLLKGSSLRVQGVRATGRGRNGVRLMNEEDRWWIVLISCYIQTDYSFFYNLPVPLYVLCVPVYPPDPMYTLKSLSSLVRDDASKLSVSSSSTLSTPSATALSCFTKAKVLMYLFVTTC